MSPQMSPPFYPAALGARHSLGISRPDTSNTMASPSNVSPPTAYKWYTITKEWSCLSMDWVASAIKLSKLSLKPNLRQALEPTPRQYHFQIEMGFKKSSTSKWPTQPPPPPAHHLASSGSAFPAQKCSSEEDKERHFTSSFCLVGSLGKSPSYNGCLKSLVLDWLEKDGLGWLKVRNEFEGPVGFFLRHATLLTRLRCTIAVLTRRYLLKPQPIYDVYQVQFWSYGMWKLNKLVNQ